MVACSDEARQLGVCVGMPLGEARSLLPTTSSRRQRQPIPKPIFERADPVADRVRLQALTLHCQRYSPLVGLEEAPEPESFWIDISGSEALFGGEQGLIDALRLDLAQQGFLVRVAIADTLGAAWAISHFAEAPVSIVPPGGQSVALASLPVAALRIPAVVIDSLQTLDVLTIGRLMTLPRTSLPSRFGKELVRQLDRALGLAPEVLTVERLVEPICIEWPFEESVSDRQTLDHVCGTLLERVLGILDTRRAGLRELTCHWLGSTAEPISLRLLRPTTDRRHLMELVRLQCERSVFLSGVMGVRMEVVEMGFPPVRQATLFDNEGEERHERELEELVDRLSNRLGAQAVLRANLQPDPLPEFSCQTVPWLSGPTISVDAKVAPSRLRCRPLRLFQTPQSLKVDSVSREGLPSRVNQSFVTQIDGPERIESGWWRGPDMKRDYYRLDLANGTRLWAFCERSSGQWFLHGLFS